MALGFSTGAGGDEMKYGGMVNVLYDFDPSVLGLGFLPVVPYVGVGVGYQWAQDRNAHFYGNTGPIAWLPGGWLSTRCSAPMTARAPSRIRRIAGVSFPIVSGPRPVAHGRVPLHGHG